LKNFTFLLRHTGFDSHLGHTKDFKNSICCFSCFHTQHLRVAQRIKKQSVNYTLAKEKLIQSWRYKTLAVIKCHKNHLSLSLRSSDVARPLSYKTKTTYFFKTKTSQIKAKTTFTRSRPLFFEDHQSINIKKRSLAEKIRPVMPVCPVMPKLCRQPKKSSFITGFLVKSFASSKIRILKFEWGHASWGLGLGSASPPLLQAFKNLNPI